MKRKRRFGVYQRLVLRELARLRLRFKVPNYNPPPPILALRTGGAKESDAGDGGTSGVDPQPYTINPHTTYWSLLGR